uniref:Uncharacterized protein n=1 Tax=Romanomermis culicivorax TaxID=13658 RepID=A0A915J300_ROMCU
MKRKCSWDQVVKLPNSKIFATLRNRKLLFRLDTNDLEIDTMSYLNFVPGKMIYNQQFDTLWIHGLDKNSGHLYFLSKVSTLNNNSRFRPQLLTNTKLNVTRIFIPSDENFTHGYLVGKNDPYKLSKIDLTNGRIVNNNDIDLKFHGCVPDQLIFVEQRSTIIVNCDDYNHFSTNLFKTTRLFIDYLTDEVIDSSRMIRDNPSLINTFDLAVSADNWLIYPDSNFGQWLLYALSSDGTYLLKFDFRIMKNKAPQGHRHHAVDAKIKKTG